MSKRPQSNSLPTIIKSYFLRGGELSFKSIQAKLTEDGMRQKDGKIIPVSTVRRVVYGLQKTIPAIEKKITEANDQRSITFVLDKKRHQQNLQRRLKEIQEQTSHTQEMSS